jgi:hypothetical protein
MMNTISSLFFWNRSSFLMLSLLQASLNLGVRDCKVILNISSSYSYSWS